MIKNDNQKQQPRIFELWDLITGEGKDNTKKEEKER